MSGLDEPALDINHLRCWIGREEVGWEFVEEELVRKYYATFDLPGDAPKIGEIAPRLIHFCLVQPAVPTARLDEDGHPQRGGFLPPVPLPRRMWAGGSMLFHDDVRVGDLVRRRSRIENVVLKEGRSGALCFVEVAHQIDVNGVLKLEERQDLVYRAAAKSEPEAKIPEPVARGVHRKQMMATPPLLFRYSALTFNAHRIHYDRRYAMEFEGYRGLVVHGPLQAAMLLNYAAELHGGPPRRFDFRGLAPLFDNEVFTLNATGEGDRSTLWIARDNGPAIMTAQAAWS